MFIALNKLYSMLKVNAKYSWSFIVIYEISLPTRKSEDQQIYFKYYSLYNSKT